MPGEILRLGTRGSKLALTQAEQIAATLRKRRPDIEIKITKVQTGGDRDQATALSQMGGTGAFTKAIETELIEHRIDVAVHSAKDLPSIMTEGLTIGAVPRREAYEDALVSRTDAKLDDLPDGAVIGTGSPRRRAQLSYQRRDLRFAEIRGNLDTRLGKLSAGEYDALVLARAGLRRLGQEEIITQLLTPPEFLPAPGQGFLVVQARAADGKILDMIAGVDDSEAHRCLEIERQLLRGLNAGCAAAVGGWARVEKDMIILSAVVLDESGSRRLTAEGQIAVADSDTGLAGGVVDNLISQGALEVIDRNG
jgi:hydroxymethylbilane synthase